jgi:predicted GNAT superfamily acetyltransferase
MKLNLHRLSDPHTFQACVELQEVVAGHALVPSRLLVSVDEVGGMILGAYDADLDPQRLCGALIDLSRRDAQGPAWHTVFYGVAPDVRNRGVGSDLRLRERTEARGTGVGLITWTIDPLRSREPHIAFNKLAAIAVGYQRNRYGELADPQNRGLATDRLLVEWWLDAPRVASVIDRGNLPHHYHVGLDRMEVVTKTRPTDNGLRRLVRFETAPHSPVILVEIPADLDEMRRIDLDLARDWRLKSRDLFESLFASGYTMTGFVHEAGRSFHLLEHADRKTVLDRTP